MREKFRGFHNHRDYLLQRFDEGLINWFIPRTPAWISSIQLTLATLPLALLNLWVGFAAHTNHLLMILFLPILIGHHLVDTLDGALGRRRGEGWVLWGFFMDKFVDFIFLASFVGALLIIDPEFAIFSFLLFVGYGGMMVQAFLEFAATKTMLVRNRKRLGPTELKAVLAILIVIAAFGGPSILRLLILVSAVILNAILVITVASVQKNLADLDRSNQRETKTMRPARSPRKNRKAKA